MLSSTAPDANPRMLLSVARARRQRHPRCVDGRGAARLLLAGRPARRPWLARLRRALEDDLFVLHFQPIVLAVRRPRLPPRGAPAARRRARRTPDRAGRFLPAAERYGLIGEIDRMVLERVAALLGRAAGRARAARSRSTSPRCRSPTRSMLADLERRLRSATASSRRGW